MAIVKPEDLTRYATSEGAPFAVGELIRRLVYTWVKPARIDAISFHSGTANNLPGWDGVLRLKPDEAGAVFSCLWELSSQDADTAKIRDDFKSRLNEELPEGWRHNRTTLAFVTYRKLRNRRGLESELRRMTGNRWYDIQILDAPALSQWISMCPPVEAWCAHELDIGAGRFGISLDESWKHWAQDTKPNISAGLMLAGRQSVLSLDDLQPRAAAVLNLQADSPEEAVAFVRAVLTTEGLKEIRDPILSRALVVGTEAQARAYAGEPPLPGSIPTTILVPPATGCAQFVAGKGHFVINALGHGARDVVNLIPLGRGLAQDVAIALASTMQLDESDAQREARDCGSSVTIWSLLNRMDRSGGLGERCPTWATRANVAESLPAALAQGWDDAYDLDKAILAKLAGKTYDDFEASLHRFINCDSPLLQRTQSVATVVAPPVAYFLTVEALTSQHVRAFKDAFEQALSWVSPSKRDEFEGRQGLHTADHRFGYSDWLREGLASTLLLISSFTARTRDAWPEAEFGSPQHFVDSLVSRTIDQTTDLAYFHALDRLLLVLSEASPSAFLSSAEKTLDRADEEVRRLFAAPSIFTPALHAGLLHSLELAAEDENYLERATRLLLRLVRCDVQAQNNRVVERLRNLYQVVRPASSTSIGQRVEVLRHLAQDFPLEVWTLLLRVISSNESGNSAPSPRWKDFGRSRRSPQTNASVAADLAEYTKLATSLAGGELGRLRQLLDIYPRLSKTDRESLSRALDASLGGNPSPEDLRGVWNEATAILERHRVHSNRPWALPEAALAPLDDLDSKLRTKLSAEEAWTWLFRIDPTTYSEEEAMFGRTMTKDELTEQQRVAIGDIKSRSGMYGLARLASLTEQPFASSTILAAHVSLEEAVQLCDVWAHSSASDDALALAYFSAIQVSAHGASWTRAVVERARVEAWSPEAQALIFMNYAASCAMFYEVAALGEAVEGAFWQRRRVGLKGNPKKLNTFMASKMLKAGRALDLLEQISYNDVRTRVLLHMVRAASIELGLRGTKRDLTMVGYYFGNALAELKRRAQVTNQHLAELEYPLFSLLQTNLPVVPSAIHEELATKPDVFMLFLRRLYRPIGATPPEAEDIQVKSRAHMAYEILHSWRTPPGSSAEGTDFSMLRAWISPVRASANAEGLGEVVDYELGRLLRHVAPNPGDKQWPSAQLADLLEEIDSEAVLHGIADEIHNSAGAQVRAMLATGEAERAQSAHWREVKRALHLRCKRARALCDLIADSFENFAQFTDRMSQLQRLRMSR